MTDFIDQLTDMLSGLGQPPAGGATPNFGTAPNYGASPTPQGAAPSTGNILARLNSPTQPRSQVQPAGSSNPLGISPPIGGGNLAASLGGLAQVNPHSSRFGAFAQGLAGGINAQQQAQMESARLGAQMQSAGLDAALKGAEIQKLQGLNDARRAGADAWNNGEPTAAAVSAPSASQAPASPAPMAAPALAAPQAPSGSPTAQPSAASGAPPQITLPPVGDKYWQDVPVEENVPRLFAKEGQARFAANRASFDPAEFARYNSMADGFHAKAQELIDKGYVATQGGGTKFLPGFLDRQTAIETAKARAEAQVKNQFAAGVGVSGTPYLPGSAPAPSASPPPQGAGAGSPSAGQPLQSVQPRGQAPAAGQSGAASMPSPQALQTPTAAIDPATASIRTAIPAAPPGGGYPVPTDLPPGARMTGLGPAGKAVQDADKDFYTAMGNAPALDQTVEKFRSMGQAFKMFESGPRADKTQGAAMIAYGLGRPDVGDAIIGGDANALQWVEKEGAPLTLNALKSATTRFSQMEFKTYYNSAVPNPGKLPQANHQMIAEGLAQTQMQQAFNADWQKAQQQGWQSPSAFYQSWSKANPASTFITSAQRQIGNFKGMDLPPPKEWTNGVIYAAPKDMTPQQHAAFDKYGLKPDGLFRFNGWGSNKPVEPIDPSHGFTSYLSR